VLPLPLAPGEGGDGGEGGVGGGPLDGVLDILILVGALMVRVIWSGIFDSVQQGPKRPGNTERLGSSNDQKPISAISSPVL